MLNNLKKYLKVKAEAMQKMQMGDLEGYMSNLREMYKLRMLIPTSKITV